MRNTKNKAIVVAALYKFADLPDFEEMQIKLKKLCAKHKIKGTLLLAKEGINGTVSGSRQAIDALNEFMKADGRFEGLEYKESFADDNPFYRTKVRLKKEIVTLGCPEADPNKVVGTYVGPEEWNKLLEDPDVTVIDVRNDYEVEIGTFKNAINPKTDTFREFPKYVQENLDPSKNKKVAMCCTGGIRCEKASSYMKQAGFEEVYHLKGGVLQYLEDTPKDKSLWQGDCFVFDNRVAVNHDLLEGKYDQCHGCRNPITEEDKLSRHYVRGVTCPKCYAKRTDAQKASAASRQMQIDLAKKRGDQHMGENRQQI